MRHLLATAGILGLAWAVVLPAASADVLFKTDFGSGDINSIFKDAGGAYMQGLGTDRRTSGGAMLSPFMVRDGVLTSSGPGSTDGSNGISDSDGGDATSQRYLLLTGLDTWPADIAIQARIRIDNQGTGACALVLKAQRKAKPDDPDSWYEFRYTTGNSAAPHAEDVDSSVPRPATSPNLRIMKVLNGHWSILAESTGTQTVAIPAVQSGGADNANGAIFRFVAKGDTLTGLVSRDGTNFTTFLQVKDTDLKTGLVGFSHYDYNPIFDDMQVDTP